MNHDEQRVLGSSLERDQAVEKLGDELERMEPPEKVTKIDWAKLIPAADQLHAPDPEVVRRGLERDRELRLEKCGILTAITEEDRDWLVRDALPIETDALYNVKAWDNKRSSLSYAFSVLVLVGLKGRGKTLGAGWLHGKYDPGVYCTEAELCASFEASSAADRALYKRARSTRVLTIDEIGRAPDAKVADAMMFEIVNARRGRPGANLSRAGHHQMWTLGLSNLAEAKFKKRFDAPTIDRIEQLGAIITVTGENLRGRVIDKLTKGET